MISWVAIDTDIGDNPKLWELADSIGNSTGIPLESCVGLVTMLLGKVASHAHDGDIAGVPDRLLEEWARWRGKPGGFAPHFRRIFVTDGVITGWAKRQGKLIDHIEKVKERDRKRKSIRNSTGIPTGTVPDLTVHNRTTTTKRARGEKEITDPRVDTVIAHYQTLHPQRRPGPKERRAVWHALEKLSYSVEDVLAAISGNASDPWHKERRKHELSYVLRDNEHIDRFRLQPKPLPEYDEAIHGPMVSDGVLSDRMDLMTSPDRKAEWARVCRLEGRQAS